MIVKITWTANGSLSKATETYAFYYVIAIPLVLKIAKIVTPVRKLVSPNWIAT